MQEHAEFRFEPSSSLNVSVSALDIAIARRWLWEQFNVGSKRRLAAPAVVRDFWAGDPIRCAQGFRTSLACLVRDGVCLPENAIAWGLAASLEGRRIARAIIAENASVSLRGLDGRLHTVDEALANLLHIEGSLSTSGKSRESDSVVIGLIESTFARGDGRIDVADGLFLAASDLAGLELLFRGRPEGKDRSIRNRARAQARHGLKLRTFSSSLGLAPRQEPVNFIEMIYPLDSDPDRALDHLESCWRIGHREHLPLLLNHALNTIPDAEAAGLSRRLRLLELGSNIFRDAESLSGLAWTSAWVEEARGAENAESVRAIVNGRKTRAHLLQLHGFISAAAHELSAASDAARSLDNQIEDLALITADITLRKAALDIIASRVGDARLRLRPLLEPGAPRVMNLGAIRFMLHVESIEIAQTLQRRSALGRRSRAYEIAMELVHDLVRFAPAASQLTVLDTVVASAMRVGDSRAIAKSLALIDWPNAGGPPNITFRIAARLKLASRLSGLSDLADIVINDVADPLRVTGLIPRQAATLM